MNKTDKGLPDNVERGKESSVSNDLDALYRRITSPASREAGDLLFSASTDDLRESYQAGATEINN